MACDLDRIAHENLREQVKTKFIDIDGVYLPEEYKLFAEQVENFEVYDDDVWVCSFQKSGTTWTQEMVWCIANNLDFEGAKVPINERFPFLEFSGTIATARIALRNPDTNSPKWVTKSVDYCKNLPRPRFIKCHLPFNLLPRQIRTGERKPKVVYIARNPKDVCISFYHHSKLLEGYSGNFHDFCRLFLGDKVAYAPYWKHVSGFWEKKDVDNFLLLKFEDMKKDLPSVIRKTAGFLNKNVNDSQVAILTEHLSFGSMKVNPALNRETTKQFIKTMFDDDNIKGEFIRNGNVGQWKETMETEMIKKFDEWTERNLVACNGLTF